MGKWWGEEVCVFRVYGFSDLVSSVFRKGVVLDLTQGR